ncbi:MAG: 8-amino-7-oxononanoate synthase [Holosporaceae bacterium]|jgi:8-amino-7-oxononanoate synthase|nr:8-amino-7-oxononanoate synthase [Holosporaceae bacterium]
MADRPDYIQNHLSDLKSRNLYRSLQRYDGKFIDFSSNDYLGLAHNEESLAAGYACAKVYGSGSTGSRLLSGNREIFEKLERLIAVDKNFEASLIFNSGFIANASVISALCIPGSIIIFDKLNHASMYYGINHGDGSKLLRYKHLNYDELEDILKKHASIKNKVIASETVFGMDGDVADIKALSYLSQKYGALLFLDEAHATGLYGKDGHGLSTDFQLGRDSTIVMGTFSKALSSSGAYVASNKLLKEYLINKSRGFIYSTALSPFCIGVAMHNWNLVGTLGETRRRIMQFSDELRCDVHKLGYKVVGSGTNVISIVFENADLMCGIHRKLRQHGVLTSLIRPPTSPTMRIRLAVNATHTKKDLEAVTEGLKK